MVFPGEQVDMGVRDPQFCSDSLNNQFFLSGFEMERASFPHIFQSQGRTPRAGNPGFGCGEPWVPSVAALGVTCLPQHC